MDKLSEKDITSALKDSSAFAKLPPAGKLKLLFEEVKKYGDVKEADFGCWNETPDRDSVITQEERFDEIMGVLQMSAPGHTLQVLDDRGLMKFCLPHCLPIKQKMYRRTYNKILSNIDNCKETDLAKRINFFMFPFGPENTRQTLEESNFEPEWIQLMTDAIDQCMTFIEIKDKKSCRLFVGKYGRDFYLYMCDYTEQLYLLINASEKPEKGKRRPKPKEILAEVEKEGDPLRIKDLDISRSDLEAIGIEGRESQNAIMDTLLKHCEKMPSDNQHDILMGLAERYYSSKLKKWLWTKTSQKG